VRTVQILVNDEWQPTELYKLQCGDYFRMFDNITPVSDNCKCIFRATSSPYGSNDGLYVIDYETC
jgi:hypothetical protein